MSKQQRGNNNSVSTSITPEQMVNEIQQRIDYLQTVQEAILYGFYGVSNLDMDVEVDEEVVTKPRRSKAKVVAKPKRRKNASNPAKNHVLITDVLYRRQQPMTLQEVFVELQSLGWKTTSKSPIALVSVTLNHMKRKGDVQVADGKWSLTSAPVSATVPSAAEQAPVEVAA